MAKKREKPAREAAPQQTRSAHSIPAREGPSQLIQARESLSIERLRQVMARTGISRSMIYQKMSEGSFPKSIALGTRAVGWLAADIDLWLSQCIASSRARQGNER